MAQKTTNQGEVVETTCDDPWHIVSHSDQNHLKSRVVYLEDGLPVTWRSVVNNHGDR